MSRLRVKKQRKNGSLFKTRSVFNLVNRLDEDLNISDFHNNPDICVVDERIPCMTWIQFAYGMVPDPERTIFRK